MKRALPLLALLGGCSLRDPRVTAPSCASNLQCSHADVCFLGECRPPSAANLSVVRLEVRPPNGSQFGLRTVQVDLGTSVINDVKLAVPLNVGDPATPGSVLQAQDGAPATAVPNATVTFSDHAKLIPDRIEQIVATTDAAGAYRARIPQGTWDVLVQAPAPLPPIRFGVLDTATPALNFIISSTATFSRLEGSVTFDGGLPLAGANVTAVDSEGAAVSAPAISQPDGGYSLYLSPNSGQPALQIGPPTDADAGTPSSSALDPFPTYPPKVYVTPLELPLPPVATVSGRVLDTSGAPIPSARVYLRSASPDWTLARSVVADADGAYTATLREGNYQLQAAPAADAASPALSAVQSASAPATGVNLVCPPKVRRYGLVLGPDGRPVGGNFQVVATRLADPLVTTRTAFTTPTDLNGVYHVIADGGRWRFEVVPPAGASLPRAIAQFDLDSGDLGESPLPAIRISPALKVGGTVRGSAISVADVPVAGAQVSFFVLDASGHGVLLGSGMSDAQGRYDIILPDVVQTTSSFP